MNILHRHSLRDLNTLGVDACAEHFVRAQSEEEIFQVLEFAKGQALSLLGGGSNVILRDFLPGWVLQPALLGRRCVRESHEAWWVQAEAGENWHEFVRWTLEQGWPGLENLSLIPGTVGAAPIQNIGAYGVELSSVFHELEAIRIADGARVVLRGDECRFGYRDSIFKQEGAGQYVITRVTFQLSKAWKPCTTYRDLSEELSARGLAHPSALEISDAVVAIRSRKLPDWHDLGNVGSFFKNPQVDASQAERLLERHPTLPQHRQLDGSVKLAAGWLIEHAGWKGRRLGPVGVYERQALVLVNHGGACARDILQLAQQITQDVRNQFGVELEREPVVLPSAVL